jgi:hypothetical protein
MISRFRDIHLKSQSGDLPNRVQELAKVNCGSAGNPERSSVDEGIDMQCI